MSNPKNVKEDQLMKYRVVTHPPFSLDMLDSGFLWEADNKGKKKMSAELDQYYCFGWCVTSASKGDYAFALHMLSSLDAETAAWR